MELQHAIRSRGALAVFSWTPRRLGRPDRPLESGVEAANRPEFTWWLSYKFDLALGAFGTGSMSRNLSADEMIFCPMSAAPQGIEAPLQRIPLRPQGPEAADVRLHRLIYSRTPYTACMVAASPLAIAEAMAALAAGHGMEALPGKLERFEPPADNLPFVAPIDAEGAYYRVRLPVAGIHALPRLDDPRQRVAILNAYRLLGDGADRLYPSISPVNSFRAIAQEYFGSEVPLLADRSFLGKRGRLSFDELAEANPECVP